MFHIKIKTIMKITIETKFNIGDKVFAIDVDKETITEGVVVAISCARHIRKLKGTKVEYTIWNNVKEKVYQEWCVFSKFEEAQEYLCCI